MGKVRIITELDTNEVSLVDSPAIKEEFLIVKSAGPNSGLGLGSGLGEQPRETENEGVSIMSDEIINENETSEEVVKADVEEQNSEVEVAEVEETTEETVIEARATEVDETTNETETTTESTVDEVQEESSEQEITLRDAITSESFNAYVTKAEQRFDAIENILGEIKQLLAAANEQQATEVTVEQPVVEEESVTKRKSTVASTHAETAQPKTNILIEGTAETLDPVFPVRKRLRDALTKVYSQ